MVQDTRQLNREAVLTALFAARPASRKVIAERSGISPATVTRAVEQLLAEGVVEETSEIISESRGRRAVELDIVADRRLAMGVDFGATNTRILVVDLLGRPIARRSVPTPAHEDGQLLAEWLADEARATAGDVWERIAFVCLGMPGAVGRQRTVSNAPNLPQVESPGFLDAVEEAFGRPMGFDNDANYALLGELHYGAATDSPNAAMLTIGYGLGAGLAIDGHILQGERGLIGEFGQLPIGPLGARLEHMVTGSGIMRRAAEAGVALSEPAALFAPDAPPALLGLRAQFDQALTIVLAAVTVASDPQTIVLGGGIATSLAPALDRYRIALEQSLRVSPAIVTARLGSYSGAVGAAVAALHQVYAALGVHPDVIVRLPGGDTIAEGLPV
ncbi:sugar kinase [Leifsonia sp. LS1]|uniref:ROK family transcriptional regulator n=1 Tax=Leifsonia sp. LS1 TaxID=2828483 RepID=UPI001CFE316E|nr:ROK family transcriptional regulator [Leifsonia sp. LS1]GIT80513.1 sugar kinase [Leifsonia sp. LS1]